MYMLILVVWVQLHVFLPVFALSTKLFKGFVHVHAYFSCMGTTSCFSAIICPFGKIIQRICTCTCLFKLYGYNFMFFCHYLLFRQNYSMDLYMYMLILVVWVQLHVFLPLFALSTKLFKGFVNVHAYLSCMGTTSCFSAIVCPFDKIIQRICTCTCLFKLYGYNFMFFLTLFERETTFSTFLLP